MDLANLPRANEIAKELKQLRDDLEFLEVVTSVDIKNVNTNRYSINVEMSSPSAQKFIENYRAELRERCRKLESEAKGL